MTADDLRALSAAATEQALRLTPCECADETGYIRQHETTCPVEWMAPIRNHADALADLIDATTGMRAAEFAEDYDHDEFLSAWTAALDALAALDGTP